MHARLVEEYILEYDGGVVAKSILDNAQEKV